MLAPMSSGKGLPSQRTRPHAQQRPCQAASARAAVFTDSLLGAGNSFYDSVIANKESRVSRPSSWLTVWAGHDLTTRVWGLKVWPCKRYGRLSRRWEMRRLEEAANEGQAERLWPRENQLCERPLTDKHNKTKGFSFWILNRKVSDSKPASKSIPGCQASK